MFAKIKKLQKNSYIQQFRDTRTLGLAAFTVVAILVTWSTIKAIETNYKLQKQISGLRQQNDVKKLENENLKLKNKYIETDQFLELAARRQFGLAAPGEKVYLVPKRVALAHASEIPNISQRRTTKESLKKPAYQRHFQAWVNFFLHRQNNQD